MVADGNQKQWLRVSKWDQFGTECADLTTNAVALNCVANGKIHKAGVFDSIWIQPAAGDAGGALGAALAAYHLYNGKPRPACADRDMMLGS